MAADQQANALLAWLGTYFVHSTLLLAAAWIFARMISRSRRFSDAAPAIREGTWRVALLAGLVTATVQRGLDVGGIASMWTIDAPVSISSAPEVAALPAEAVPVPAHAPRASARRNERGSSAPAQGLPRFVPLLVPAHIALLPLFETTAVAERAPAPERIEVGIAEAAPASAATVAAPERPATLSVFSWPRALLTLWLIGVAIGGVHWAREWLYLRRRLRGRVTLDRGPTYESFARLCERTRTTQVRLTCAPALGTPITLGLWNAEIVLPPRATTQLSPDELEALFAHELAHVNRADPLWLVVYRALEVVFFFQPLNRIARVRLVDEAELLADDWAATQLESRVSLASCLTEIAGWIVSERRALPAPAMAARGTRLTVRVRRLLDEEHHPENARRPSGLLLLAGLAVTGVALFGPGVAAERPRSAEEVAVEQPSTPNHPASRAAGPALVVGEVPDTARAVESTPAAISTMAESNRSTAALEVPTELEAADPIEALRIELDALRAAASELASCSDIQAELDALQQELELIESESAELELLYIQLLAPALPIDRIP